MEMTSEIEKYGVESEPGSVLKKRREIKVERNDETDVFKFFLRKCGAESAKELVL
jgi:hypothetical protein